MNRRLSLFLYLLLPLLLLPSCFEDEIENEDIIVVDRGGDRRQKEKETYEKGEDEEEQKDQDPTDNDDTFTLLKGIYAGQLFSPDPDDDPSNLDVTVGTTVKGTQHYFDLALYNAVVTGMELGDLVFTGIPATYNESEKAWTFNLKGQEVELMGGVIQAKVDVDGKITEDMTLKFSVTIDEPVLTLNYEGKKKASDPS